MLRVALADLKLAALTTTQPRDMTTGVLADGRSLLVVRRAFTNSTRAVDNSDFYTVIIPRHSHLSDNHFKCIEPEFLQVAACHFSAHSPQHPLHLNIEIACILRLCVSSSSQRQFQGMHSNTIPKVETNLLDLCDIETIDLPE